MVKQRITAVEGDTPPSDDALAFRAAVRDVRPLAHAPPPVGLVKPGRRPRRLPAPLPDSLDADSVDATMPIVDPLPTRADGSDLPVMKGGDTLTFQRAGVQTQVMRRLRRGLFPVEGELDLHGLTQTAARDQLGEFLSHARHTGRRCVRIIHGKGYRSGARGPILKIAVDLWLRRHWDVMAFTSARPLDGGTGALYVLLRV